MIPPAEIASEPVADVSDNDITKQEFMEQNLRFVEISEQNFGPSIRVSAHIDVPPEGRASVSPYFGGYIKDIHLVPGQEVKKSETLLVLENPEFLNIQRDYVQVMEELVYLTDDYERQKTLLEENISSRKSFLKAESDYKQAQAQYSALREQLILMGLSVRQVEQGIFTSEITLTAPMDGFITDVHAVKGQFLPAAAIAVNIINTEHLHLEIQVFEKDISKIRENQTVRVTIPGVNTHVYGKIYLIGKEITGEERAVLVHAHLDDEKTTHLNPGLFLETEIFLEDRWGNGLHNSSITNKSIWITRSETWPLEMEQLVVETGIVSGDYTEIKSEIDENFRIVGGL